MPAIRALTLDLDDTLWPVWPTIHRAEAALHDWLAQHAPAFARAHGPPQLAALRRQLAAEHPELAHDLSRLRLLGLQRALARAGEDPALAGPAFEVFLEHRQRVDFFADALPALHRLAPRYPIVAVTNGNADLARMGIAGCFAASVSAGDVGVAKPHPAIFMAAAARLGLPPQALLHVGDDARMDVQASLDAGWAAAAWVRRGDAATSSDPALVELAARPAVWPVAHLLQVCERLGV